MFINSKSVEAPPPLQISQVYSQISYLIDSKIGNQIWDTVHAQHMYQCLALVTCPSFNLFLDRRPSLAQSICINGRLFRFSTALCSESWSWTSRQQGYWSLSCNWQKLSAGCVSLAELWSVIHMFTSVSPVSQSNACLPLDIALWSFIIALGCPEVINTCQQVYSARNFFFSHCFIYYFDFFHYITLSTALSSYHFPMAFRLHSPHSAPTAHQGFALSSAKFVSGKDLHLPPLHNVSILCFAQRLFVLN